MRPALSRQGIVTEIAMCAKYINTLKSKIRDRKEELEPSEKETSTER